LLVADTNISSLHGVVHGHLVEMSSTRCPSVVAPTPLSSPYGNLQSTLTGRLLPTRGGKGGNVHKWTCSSGEKRRGDFCPGVWLSGGGLSAYLGGEGQRTDHRAALPISRSFIKDVR